LTPNIAKAAATMLLLLAMHDPFGIESSRHIGGTLAAGLLALFALL
jgi:hypothetical protein